MTIGRLGKHGWRELAAAIAIAASAPSCTGSLGAGGNERGDAEGGGPSARGGGPSGETGPGAWAPAWQKGGDAKAAGRLPLAMLTGEQYTNTVRDLFGDATLPAFSFPGEVAGDSGFATVGNPSAVNVQDYMQAAESLAATAIKSLSTLAPCAAAASPGDDCAQTFINDFGHRAYRRPLSADEQTAHFTFYKTTLRGTLGYDFPNAIRVVVQAMLQSPDFLYRWEAPPAPPAKDGEALALGAHQLASRLSYFLWSSMPDAALLAAADSGAVTGADELRSQALRLLADPRAARTVESFHRQLLNLDAVTSTPINTGLYPAFTPALARSMHDEVTTFVDNVILQGDGKLATLLTADFSFLNGPLAAVYGVPGMTGDALVKTPLDPGRRAGLLTMPALMTVNSTQGSEGNPITRGKLVRTQLLCQTMPPPPPNVPPLQPPAPHQTIREQFAGHVTGGACEGCHRLMDPIGFGFLNYDAIGQYITSDPNVAGAALDASGVINDYEGVAPSFDGAVALASLLATSTEVRACFTEQWFRFGLGRAEGESDAASLSEAFSAFAASDYNIRELLVALVTSRTFRYRTPSPGEPAQ